MRKEDHNVQSQAENTMHWTHKGRLGMAQTQIHNST